MTVLIQVAFRYAAGRSWRIRSLVILGPLVLVGVSLYAARGEVAPNEQLVPVALAGAKQPDKEGIATDPADKYPGLNLIPWPKFVQTDGGRMKLTAESRIVVAQEELKPLAEVLSS